MQTKRLTLCLVSLLFLLCTAARAQAPSGSSPDPLPVWTADEKLLKSLTATNAIPGYALSVPTGYQAVQAKQQMGSSTATAYGWKGTPRANGVAPSLLVVVVAVPKEETDPTADNALNSLLGSLRRRSHDDWTQTPPEHGLVNGIPFARALWKATVDRPQGPLLLHGLAYAAVDGSTALFCSSQDSEPDYKESLALAEASVLTLHKAPDKP